MSAAAHTADTVVIGAGSAGSVVAARLADAGRDVLVLESGALSAAPPRGTAMTTLPIGPRSDRVVRYREDRGRDVVRGCGVGGSSTVNGGYYLRGHQSDYAGWPWPIEEISAGFDRLDGNIAGGPMNVSPFTDGELDDVPRAFEAYWRRTHPMPGSAPVSAVWPRIGLNRVRSNRIDGRRRTADVAMGLVPELGQRGGSTARMVRGQALRLIVEGTRATGVVTDRGRIDAGEVICAAGTLGTAALVLPLVGPLRTHEHPELIVRFRPRRRVRATALLQSVAHTGNGLEIRSYGDDFARFIDDVPRSGIPIGVADMTTPTVGEFRADRGTVRLDLGEVSPRSHSRMTDGAEQVLEMLASPQYAELVEPGSAWADERIGMSSHAWGTLPAGTMTDSAGALKGFEGLRVVDGSVLPSTLRSGPHATVMMVATLIADRLVGPPES